MLDLNVLLKGGGIPDVVPWKRGPWRYRFPRLQVPSRGTAEAPSACIKPISTSALDCTPLLTRVAPLTLTTGSSSTSSAASLIALHCLKASLYLQASAKGEKTAMLRTKAMVYEVVSGC